MNRNMPAGALWFVLLAVAWTSSCSDKTTSPDQKTVTDGSPAPYITDWSNPFATLKAGTTAKLSVKLSAPVAEQTYIDMEISSLDQQRVSTNPENYLVVAPQTDGADVQITAKTVANPVAVLILFRIRNTKESRPFSFQVIP